MRAALQALILTLAAVPAMPAAASFATIFPSLTGNAPEVRVGDTVLISIVADFTQEPTIGGSLEIVWDPNALELTQLTVLPVGMPEFARDPVIGDGIITSWAFGTFNGFSGPAVLGIAEFTVLPTLGGTTSVFGQCLSDDCFPFVSAIETSIIDVDFGSVTLTRVPLPAGFWLLAGALPLLGALRRS